VSESTAEQLLMMHGEVQWRGLWLQQ
jgi:hypothetical protein